MSEESRPFDLNDESQVFRSGNYGRGGEFQLSLSAVDYTLLMHALVLAGNSLEVVTYAGTELRDRSRPYDELHDRLMDWNHCDEEPIIEEDD